jgi:anti-sigma factor RsiW
MSCDKALLTQAYLDGELDPAGILATEAHLDSCAACRAQVAETRALREALRAVAARHAAPPGLDQRIRQALDAADASMPAAPRSGLRLRRFLAARRQWFAGAVSGAVVAAAVAVALVMLRPSDDTGHMIDDLAGAHIRSLMAQHLLDIGSSDQKTVIPWFKGRVDVSPPVVDLSAEGYDLSGGRADFVDGKRVAAIVYGHGDHIINLFVWPAYEGHPRGVARRDGYNLFMWSKSHLVFCAVSDDSVTDLKTFAHLVNTKAQLVDD